MSEENKKEQTTGEPSGQTWDGQESPQDSAETAQQPQSPEDVAGEDASSSGKEGGKAPEKTPEQALEEKMAELNDRLLRTMAEYDNFRKRSVKEKEAIYPQATAAAVAQFTPILDTFERALSGPCSDAEFKKGVEMIFQNFKGALSNLGVEEFGVPGDMFDPEMHNAVAHVEDDAAGQNSIVEVFQKGYKLGSRIIRHAMVKVAN